MAASCHAGDLRIESEERMPDHDQSQVRSIIFDEAQDHHDVGVRPVEAVDQKRGFPFRSIGSLRDGGVLFGADLRSNIVWRRVSPGREIGWLTVPS